MEEKEKIKTELTEQMFQHRKRLGLTQRQAATQLNTSEKTYQKWEARGEGLSDFFDILKIFKVLRFSTTEIINVLGLPPLTLNEVKELYQDEETLKGIRENTLYSYIRQKCDELGSITIEKLLYILSKEYFKRKGYKWGD